jgi:CheY-like chemotaxis protein
VPATLEYSFRVDSDSRQIVGTCRDVTAAQNIEEVRRQRIAAERASLAKSEFMSQVSHELRTPLNAILGFAQLMAMDNDEPLVGKQQERLQILHQSGLRLLSLVDQLLQIGKIEQGKVSLRSRAVNVYSLVRRCIDALAPMAAERDVAIQVDVAGSDTAAVRADSNALEQVLVNLLSNAIKYNRHGGRVTLRYRAEDDGEITVDDTGPGLTASQMARLFEPFNRLDAARGNVQGTGLGLVISRQLVEAMGGTMQAWSEVGKGSRFRVTLPRARSTRAKDVETLPLDMPSQWAGDEQFRVLYIEDDEVNLVLMDQLFAAQADWTLTVAMTGAAGLTEAVRQRPDVILLDLNLPDMAGQEVLQRLRLDRRTRDIPVVAVSADAMPASVRRSRGLGFVDYWTKPLDLRVTASRLKGLASMPQ